MQSVVIIGNVTKDVYLRLDNRKNNFETDQNNIKWLDIAFNDSHHNYFSRVSIYGEMGDDQKGPTLTVKEEDVPEKTLVEAFKKAVEVSYNSIGNKPGLLAVSGLNYTVSPAKKTLVGMNFVDKDGVEHKIDVDNPREDKTYKVVADSYIMSWGKEFGVLSPKEKCEEYPFNKAYLTCEYIKHLDKPIVVNQTGRIRYSD